MNEGKVIDLSEVESQFREVCCIPDCETPAEWLGRASHSYDGCPYYGYVCTLHKSTAETQWAQDLQYAPDDCLVCGGIISGQVSDNLKWMKL